MVVAQSGSKDHEKDQPLFLIFLLETGPLRQWYDRFFGHWWDLIYLCLNLSGCKALKHR